MTLVDANILLYAYNADAPEHDAARRWLESLLASSEWTGFCWLTLWAFVRIATNPRVFPRPLAPREAFDILNGWLALPRAVVVKPGPRHAELLEHLVVENQAAGGLLSDAALAALALEHGATLASTDRDFSRFPGVRWENPLQVARH